MILHNLKSDEREVIQLAKHFGKRAEQLIKLGKLSPEHQQVIESCARLAEQVMAHAAHREAVLEKREKLRKIVQDHASCPQCHKNAHLKFMGQTRNEKGWQSNKYKCRRCNIQFTWNRPNNPWDLLRFMADYVTELSTQVTNENLPPETRQQSETVINQLLQNINELQPVLTQADEEFADMKIREEEMVRLLPNIKGYLQLEKIKLDLKQID